MAVPKNATILRGAPLQCGVILGVSPSSDPTFDVEIARAPTSSGTYETVARLTPIGQGVPVMYKDVLPDDNVRRLYKARAVKGGWADGDYTAAVSVKPVVMPEILPNITPLTGKGIGANIFLSTAQSIQFRGAASPSSYPAHIRTAALAFRAGSTGVSYSYGIGTLVPTSRNASTATNYRATVALPIGVSVYKASWYYQRTTASAVFRAELYGVSTAGTASLKYGKTSTAIGTNVLTSSSFTAFTVNSGYVVSQVALKSTHAGGNKASLIALDLYYRTPSVQAAI